MPGQARWFGGTFNLPTGSVSDADVADDAGIQVEKMEHLFKPGTCFGFAIGATPTTREEIVFTAGTDGVIRGFHALLNDTGTNTSITFDLKVNGVSVLTGTVSVTHADADRAVKDGTINTAAVNADDVISILMTVTSSTGAQGPYAWLDFDEETA